MILESKKTKKRIEVSIEVYESMKEHGSANRYRVIDNNDIVKINRKSTNITEVDDLIRFGKQKTPIVVSEIENKKSEPTKNKPKQNTKKQI